ncbi:MAG: TIGR01620 family protein [Hoeflea sp.]|uniref:YcjF family protein n=1 Tax=Hoeflea sp. TaxID=1940281 RepID=UPI001DCE38BD|nr:TIGR01620 family protein [Hoeflea sp.]MBU4530440.1 TIGR01620 family protein [Alphaproteobacteria bacterium]MBU4545227.1 TIGR01620 family protein [Alphaproteobacteria bacterium]MBU4549573.1 TIGR01620 family protein [Alphaproteobacteria bacterium]MBV1722030.1 TIGR01620 family protein [Hoeflea sp.]MBV1761380.1 TIGR01620 family protein [Hoeflea sp.]
MTDHDQPPRKPRAFAVDEPVRKAAPDKTGTQPRSTGNARKPSAIPVATVSMTMEEDDPFLPPPAALEALTPPPARPRRRRLTAGKILTASLGFLLLLALGVWTDSLIRDLFDRLPWLGWVAFGAAVIAVLALIVLAIREFIGLRRLAQVANLRDSIAAKSKSATAKEARALSAEVVAQIAANPLSARGRKSLKALDDEIIDGPHYLAFTERELMASLDRQARTLIINAARRVSVVTAVSPRAFVDLAYVGFEAVRLIRNMAELYGGRPGTIGMIRLFRDVIAHLAVTGAIAAGDSLIQQVVGHGIAAKLSARLGEGVINGLMTARIGISAMDLCRPMPFTALKRPGMGDFMSDLTVFASKTAAAEKPQ